MMPDRGAGYSVIFRLTALVLKYVILRCGMSRISISSALVGAAVLLLLVSAFPADNGKVVNVNGFVLDSACAFTKNLSKPISADCARACAKAGSPLVILAGDGTIYWPIADTTPSSGQNDKLLPFAGEKVTASGRVYQRGGSNAIVIEKIAALPSGK